MNQDIPKLRIKAVQFEIEPRNPESNTQKMLAAINELRASADLLVFAEMAVPGYFIGDDWERDGFLERCKQCHEILQAASEGLTVVFGSVGIDARYKGEDGRTRLYNGAYVFQNKTLVPACHLGLDFWPKTLMANYREFEDSRHFYDLRKWAQDQKLPPEAWFQPFTICKKTSTHTVEFQIGLSICEDAWSDDYALSPLNMMHENSGKKKIDLVLNLSASPFTRGKAHKRARVFGKRSAEIKTPILFVNALGVQNNGKNIFVFDGGSSLFSEEGVKQAQAFAEDTLCAELTKQHEAKINGTGGAASGFQVHTPDTKIAAVNPSSIDEANLETCQALLYALKKTLDQWKIQNVIVGASGGIDSSLSAALFTWVLGPNKVTLVNMPSRYNSKQTQDAARELAQNLGTAYLVFPIEKGLQETCELLFPHGEAFGLKSAEFEHVVQNMQARERGARILAAVAAAKRGVFSCNANKSELTVGYSTLYGDAAGFLAPLGDLWKGEVYAVAAILNSCYFKRDVIPQACFDLPPSAELSDSQNVDEGKGDPFCYPYHDKLFKMWVEGWKRPDLEETLRYFEAGTLHERLGVPASMIASLFPSGAHFAKDAERWWSLYTGLAAFKRVQTPPLVTLSQRSFGIDHKEPIGPAPLSANYPALLQRIEKLQGYPGESSIQKNDANMRGVF